MNENTDSRDYIPDEIITEVIYDRVFGRKDDHNSRFVFSCDENGEVMNPNHETYLYCLSPEGQAVFDDLGVRARISKQKQAPWRFREQRN